MNSRDLGVILLLGPLCFFLSCLTDNDDKRRTGRIKELLLNNTY